MNLYYKNEIESLTCKYFDWSGYNGRSLGLFINGDQQKLFICHWHLYED